MTIIRNDRIENCSGPKTCYYCGKPADATGLCDEHKEKIKAQKTPETLLEAIRNGLEQNDNRPHKLSQERMVEFHVRDFLAQRFTAAVLGEANTFEELWNLVTGEDWPGEPAPKIEALDPSKGYQGD